MFDKFFVNQAEAFYTINMIPGVYIGKVEVGLFIGILLFIVVLSIVLFKKRIEIFKTNFNISILYVCLFFWLPLYLIFSYNNAHDMRDNYDYVDRNLQSYHKNVVRLCNLGYTHGNGERWCALMSYVRFIKRTLPLDSRIYVLAPHDYYAYLVYNLYPSFDFASNLEEAEYVVLYYPVDYLSREGSLYKKISEGYEKLLGFKTIDAFHSGAEVFKRSSNAL
ncbi:hypothetical protein ISS03_00060 [Patescibacteria group bacterium]|nr:hypothetical protein [Patescibacteria group bacterium]